MQNDGEAADREHSAAAAAATGDQKADRAKSKKREAARAAAKEVVAEQERRKAELEMLMMPDAELRTAGELPVGSCLQPPSALELEADPGAHLMPSGGQTALGGQIVAASKQHKLSRKDRIKQKKARKAASARADSDDDVAADSGAYARMLSGV